MIKPFVDIQNRLEAEVKALRYNDEDWGQLDNYGNSPPVQWPCALIDCDDISVSQAGRLTMVDSITVVVRVADLRLSNTSAQAPAFQKEGAYRLFETIQEVARALHGWTGTPECYGRLQRTGQRRIRRKDGVRLYEITFGCVLYNSVAQRHGQQVKDYVPAVDTGG
jgi:hypothetical protein